MKGNDKGAGAIGRLQSGLTGNRSMAGTPYLEEPSLLRGYAAYYHPVSVAQMGVILNALRSRGYGPFAAVADFGSGSGAVSESLARRGAESCLLVDHSERALVSASSAVLRAAPSCAVTTRAADIEAIAADPLRALSLGGLAGTFDCISFGHSLNELWKDREDRVSLRIALLDSLSPLLAPAGLLLALEPALLATSRDLLAVRDGLVTRGWSVVAPCVGRSRRPCPALSAGPNHTCHEDVPWVAPRAVAEAANALGLEKGSLKMAWFAFAPPSAGDPPSPYPEEASRVVSEPMRNKAGRLRRLICGAGGRRALSVKEGSPVARSSGFDALERGSVIEVRGAESRGAETRGAESVEGGLGVGEDTVIRVLDRVSLDERSLHERSLDKGSQR